MISQRYLLGFDPGGVDAFGWAACPVDAEPRFGDAVSGTCSHAAEAVDAALNVLPGGAIVKAAGIDAPLFFSRTGGRDADKCVRDAIRAAGCEQSSGTVQHPNSLRGACLVQGLLVVDELLGRIPSIRLTESHPKALLWLWPPAREISASTEHERDALIALWSAWASDMQPEGWRDLFVAEPASFVPLTDAVGYWMPLSDHQSA